MSSFVVHKKQSTTMKDSPKIVDGFSYALITNYFHCLALQKNRVKEKYISFGVI